MLCESEALGILGGISHAGSKRRSKLSTNEMKCRKKRDQIRVGSLLCDRSPESLVKWDGLQYLSQEAYMAARPISDSVMTLRPFLFKGRKKKGKNFQALAIIKNKL